MNDKVKRIALIVLLLSTIVYTVFNYLSNKIDISYLVVVVAFMGFLLMGQIAALIREWDQD